MYFHDPDASVFVCVCVRLIVALPLILLFHVYSALLYCTVLLHDNYRLFDKSIAKGQHEVHITEHIQRHSGTCNGESVSAE